MGCVCWNVRVCVCVSHLHTHTHRGIQPCSGRAVCLNPACVSQRFQRVCVRVCVFMCVCPSCSQAERRSSQTRCNVMRIEMAARTQGNSIYHTHTHALTPTPSGGGCVLVESENIDVLSQSGVVIASFLLMRRDQSRLMIHVLTRVD